MRLLVVPAPGGEPDPGLVPVVADVPGRDQEPVLDHVDGLARVQREGQGLAGMVGAERDVAGALRPHHDQRHPGAHPLPAALHGQGAEADAGIGVEQRVVGEVDPVVVVQPHLGHGHVGAADLAGGTAEPDPGHVADRRLLDPAGIGDLQPDVDRRAAVRAGPAPALARHAAVRAGVGAFGRWHRHVNPYSEPWWTYMDWMPTRPGPVISARYMPRLSS